MSASLCKKCWILTRPKGPDKPLLRRRRNWSHEDDETLLDAEAIIRARARGKPNAARPGRAALVQIFPDVGAQTAHGRIKKLLGLPGKQAYFELLEDAWYDIWVEYRGKEALPDPDPDSMTEFDLPAQIRLLRENIVKFDL